MSRAKYSYETMKVKSNIIHNGRLREMEQNFAFCEWEPYIGTAPEQKAKNAKRLRNSIFLRRFIYIITKRVVEDADPYGNIITITYYKFGVVLTTLSTV